MISQPLWSWTPNQSLRETWEAEEVGTLVDQIGTDPNGMAKGYIPTSSKILHATPLVHPKGKAELNFTAPSTRGRYPFLCTFPGLWRMMRGELLVD